MAEPNETNERALARVVDALAVEVRAVCAVCGKASDPIHDVIERWLTAAGEKSGSARTPKAYRALIEDYRQTLQAQGLDLNADPRTLAEQLSGWANRPRRRDGAPVSDATRALRIAAVGAFYTFAIEDFLLDEGRASPFRGVRAMNPAKLKTIVKAPTPKKKEVYGLASERVEAAIRAIDTSSPTALRDVTFLALAFTTGRRITELRGLQLNDITRADGKAIAHWRRTKGHGDGEHNILAPETASYLEAWIAELRRLAAGRGVSLPEDATLWPRLDPAAVQLDVSHPIGYTGLQRLYDRYLGTTRTHQARHSFAIALLEDGASVVEIMEALGHADLKVTTTYVNQLKRGLEKDRHASAVARRHGFVGFTGLPGSTVRRGATTRPLTQE